MNDDTAGRLDRIRGRAPAREHNARTISALTANPGCARRAVLDAAGVDKGRLASHVGFPSRFGQSPFALARGNAFEAQVKADGCAELLRLLRERLHLPIPEVGYVDLGDVGGNTGREVRHARTRAWLAHAAANDDDAGTLHDHPMLRLDVGGRQTYLEPDLIAFRLGGQFHIVEIKSFAIIDGQAEVEKVTAAATQAAVYVLALREVLGELGFGPGLVATDAILVCPENFANRPTAAFLDIRKQITVLTRQLSRLRRIDALLDLLPAHLTFDLAEDGDGVPTRSAADLAAGLQQIQARYAPECLATCEMCFFCRDEAAGHTEALGRDVLDELGGLETVGAVLGFARETRTPAPDQVEAARSLRQAFRLRQECLGVTG